MDWFSWLSKTGLEQSLVYEYGLAFAHNELEEEDIAYFDHEFLQSMGISIAKHRLEILKLAKKEKGAVSSPHPAVSRVLIAIKRAKRCLSNYLRTWVRTEESSAALVVVPRPGYGSRWRGAMLKRNKKLVMAQQGSSRLLLTNGGSPVVIPGPTRLDSFSSPVMIYDVHKDHQEKKKVDGDDQGEDVDEYWTTAGVEEIRWDTMFQNLKPT